MKFKWKQGTVAIALTAAMTLAFASASGAAEADREKMGASSVTQKDNNAKKPHADLRSKLYTYEEALSMLNEGGADGLVKRYIEFRQDPTFTPSIANPDVVIPDFANTVTFVDYSFTVKPSIFSSLRGVNSSVLDGSRKTLWVGTNDGVTRISLEDIGKTNGKKDNDKRDSDKRDNDKKDNDKKDNPKPIEMKSYTKENGQLLDNKVLLLIDDGSKGVFAITETGVSHIYQ